MSPPCFRPNFTVYDIRCETPEHANAPNDYISLVQISLLGAGSEQLQWHTEA